MKFRLKELLRDILVCGVGLVILAAPIVGAYMLLPVGGIESMMHWLVATLGEKASALLVSMWGTLCYGMSIFCLCELVAHIPFLKNEFTGRYEFKKVCSGFLLASYMLGLFSIGIIIVHHFRLKYGTGEVSLPFKIFTLFVGVGTSIAGAFIRLKLIDRFMLGASAGSKL